MQDSVPPASITSESPRRMMAAASPMAWAPVVQAVLGAQLGPCSGSRRRDQFWVCRPVLGLAVNSVNAAGS